MRFPLAALTAAWPEVVGDADRAPGVAAEDRSRRNPARRDRVGDVGERARPARQTRSSSACAARLGTEAPAEAPLRGRPDPRGRDAPREAAGGVPDALADVPAEVASEAAAAASAIDDPELRELVARAARASLLKARSGREF